MTTATSGALPSRSIHWRAELRLALLAASETCWLYAIVLTVGTMAGLPREVSWVGIFLVYWVGLQTGRLLPRLPHAWRLLQLLTILIAVVTIVAAMRIGMYSDVNIADLSWLPTYLGRVVGFFEQITPEVISTLLLVIAFVRALNFSQRPLTLWTVGYEFRLGTVILFAVAVLSGFTAPVDLQLTLFLYFAFCLLSIALARIEDAGQPGAIGGRWFVVMLAMLVVVLLAGWALTQLLTLDRVNAFFAFISPLAFIVQAVITIIALPLFYIFEFLFSLLAPLFAFLNGALANVFPTPTEPNPQVNQVLDQFANSLNALAPYLRIMGIMLVLLWLGWMIARALNKRMNQVENEMVTHEPLDEEKKLEKERHKRTVSARPHYDLRAESVRRIYAALQAQAETLDLKRREAETPHEYLPRLTERFPDAAPALKAITNSYVAVHYAQKPATDAEVRDLRALWQTTREQMRKTEGKREER